MIFFLADSLGNNLLPYPLPSNPISMPNDFRAKIIPSGKSLYYNNRFTKQFGYTFVFYDLISKLKENGESYVYMIDPKTNNEQFNTIFSVQLCFKDKCDTLRFCADLSKLGLEHKNIKYYVADWITRNNDTMFNVSEEIYPLLTQF